MIEPNFPEDEKSLELIEKTAKAWNASQRGKTPTSNSHTKARSAVVLDPNDIST